MFGRLCIFIMIGLMILLLSRTHILKSLLQNILDLISIIISPRTIDNLIEFIKIIKDGEFGSWFDSVVAIAGDGEELFITVLVIEGRS